VGVTKKRGRKEAPALPVKRGLVLEPGKGVVRANGQIPSSRRRANGISGLKVKKKTRSYTLQIQGLSKAGGGENDLN